jgi:hypothetical protein
MNEDKSLSHARQARSAAYGGRSRCRRPARAGAGAGADVRRQPFRPVLRGLLLTGRGKAWLRMLPAGDGAEGEAARHALFWSPTVTDSEAPR